MDNDLRRRLIEVARIPNNTINGQYLCDELYLGLDLQNRYDRAQFYDMLGEVSEHEYAKGRPLLSSLVVLKMHNFKRDCFMKICHRLGMTEDGDTLVKVDHLSEQKQSCYEYWQQDRNYQASLED